MSNADCKHQLNCRLCNKRNLSTVIDLKKTPLANSFLKISELKRKEKFYPLKVNFCKNCSHLQLSHTVNAKNMFDDYLYLTNTSKQNASEILLYADDISYDKNENIIARGKAKIIYENKIIVSDLIIYSKLTRTL